MASEFWLSDEQWSRLKPLLPTKPMLREAMVQRAVRATEKIGAQGLVASRLIAFAHGSRFKPDAPSASRSARLSPASHDPRGGGAGGSARRRHLRARLGLYQVRCDARRAARAIGDASRPVPAIDPRAGGLLVALDSLNARYGRNTVRLAAEGQGERSYDTKRSQKSPSWTTRLADIRVAC